MKYNINIQSTEDESWASLVSGFADFSIYQTIAYQRIRSQKDKAELSYIRILDESDRLVSAMLMRVIKVPVLGLRIGYIQRGPLVEHKEDGLLCTTEMFKVLHDYLVSKKIHVLRVVPNQFEGVDVEEVGMMLQSAGFQMKTKQRPYRTMLLSLEGSEEELLKRFNRGWRRNLKKAEKANVVLEQTFSSEPFEDLERMYAVSQARKGFRGISVKEFAETQKRLPLSEKMLVTSASINGEPGTILVTSLLGTTADDILVATSDAGRACGTSYLSYWNAFLVCRQKGVMAYDLGGIDPEHNPSVYRFKSGTGACDSSSIGTYDAYCNKGVQWLWNALELLRGTAR